MNMLMSSAVLFSISFNPVNLALCAGGSLLLGLIIAAIVVGVMKGQLKTVREKNEAGDYMKRDSLKMVESKDTFLYREVEKRAKPKANEDK